ncbi:MAG: hypothetical protein HY473_00960 [Candidatus Sungbacteria bacterium]|uniref:Uncharacterized protein n=1 Tax=Candidatus Sungiibacteriota bacterium TaxID=2750080 RepID=A0A933DT99_9BACT|nr:hypothetical protein [Candidatus Sungbacteria bacterium]
MDKCFCGTDGTWVCSDCKKRFCPEHGRQHEKISGHMVLDPVEAWLTSGAK